jgi:hypothetical protein
MRRYFESLRPADLSTINSVPNGLFLVRVDRVRYRRQAQKPFYQIRFAVLEPKHLTGCLHLPPEVKRELKQGGWSKGLELAKLARRGDGQDFDCNLLAQSSRIAKNHQRRISARNKK